MHVPYLPRSTRLPVLRLYLVAFCPIKGLTTAAAVTAAVCLFGAFCFVGTAAGQSNSPPVIPHVEPGFCIQDQAITPFSISVSDPDGDDVTVTVTGLPPGLSFSNGRVSGTPMADLPLIPPNEGRDYTVTIKADDGVNTPVTKTFNYSVRWGQARITVPGDRTYKRGEEIAAFGITIEIDENSGIVAVTGLPPGLSWSDGQVNLNVK